MGCPSLWRTSALFVSIPIFPLIYTHASTGFFFFFSTLYNILCSLSLHSLRIHKTQKRESNIIAQAGSQFVKDVNASLYC